MHEVCRFVPRPAGGKEQGGRDREQRARLLGCACRSCRGGAHGVKHPRAAATAAPLSYADCRRQPCVCPPPPGRAAAAPPPPHSCSGPTTSCGTWWRSLPSTSRQSRQSEPRVQAVLVWGGECNGPHATRPAPRWIRNCPRPRPATRPTPRTLAAAAVAHASISPLRIPSPVLALPLRKPGSSMRLARRRTWTWTRSSARAIWRCCSPMLALMCSLVAAAAAWHAPVSRSPLLPPAVAATMHAPAAAAHAWRQPLSNPLVYRLLTCSGNGDLLDALEADAAAHVMPRMMRWVAGLFNLCVPGMMVRPHGSLALSYLRGVCPCSYRLRRDCMTQLPRLGDT